MEDVNIVEEKKESSFEQQGQHDKRPSALDELDHVFDQCAEAPYEDDNKPSTLRQRRGNTGLPDEEGFYSSGAHDGSSKNFSNLSDSGNGQDNEEEKDPKTEDDDEVEEGLPTSIFSLIFLADLKSAAHIYAVIVYAIQVCFVVCFISVVRVLRMYFGDEFSLIFFRSLS